MQSRGMREARTAERCWEREARDAKRRERENDARDAKPRDAESADRGTLLGVRSRENDAGCGKRGPKKDV